MTKPLTTRAKAKKTNTKRNAPPSQPDYSSPELRLTISIVRTGRIWRSLLDEHLRKIGQSASRMEAMATILSSPPSTTQIQIAKRIGIEGPTLTRTLDMLEADGLVERLADPSDRRNKHLRLTAEGINILDEIMTITSELRSRLLQDIPAGDIDKTSKLLELIQDRLESGLPPETA
ncbi:MarR family winged helix-turn-helix transcriptional regulator [Marinicaulis aureus]|uniref:MarR family winged helix-turn-helix transcriptional regulator n=1 Tax=Hyphococcus aureus TaxID=2666033 RepID=A0ABW1KYA6_9PROT